MVLYGSRKLERREQIYALLARSAKDHWGLDALPDLARQTEGKPWFPNRPDLAFNVSHSGSFGLCALSEGPVGVDIQRVKQWRPSLPGRVCSRAELDWLEGQEDYWRAFVTLWTLKESRVKQSGRGLRDPIRAIRIPLPTPDKTRYQLDGLWFGLYSESDWIGAVCGTECPPETILWEDE